MLHILVSVGALKIQVLMMFKSETELSSSDQIIYCRQMNNISSDENEISRQVVGTCAFWLEGVLLVSTKMIVIKKASNSNLINSIADFSWNSRFDWQCHFHLRHFYHSAQQFL